MDVDTPVAEVLVEGELSPFEHEALYKLLKKPSPTRRASLL